MGNVSANTKDLSYVGEVEIIVEFRAGPNLADL